MALPDRGANVLAALLTEPRLRDGQLSFITHSFGGLIFEQLLRIAVDRSPVDERAAAFAARVSGVLFLGTPHGGSPLATLANWASALIRPSEATKGLSRNDPNLRALNHWFRTYVSTTGLVTRTLVETKKRWFGLAVEPDGADPGLSTVPIPVDVDHSGIAAPPSRTSQVYREVIDFVAVAAAARDPKKGVHDAALEEIKRNTSKSADASDRIEQQLAELTNVHANVPAIPVHLVDSKSEQRLSRLRRMRFFVGSDSTEGALRLGISLLEGDLAGASPAVRCRGLAWCARVLASQADHRKQAADFVEAAGRLNAAEEVHIAQAMLHAFGGDLPSALSELSRLDSPMARGAAVIALSNLKTAEELLDWLRDSKVELSTLDADGKFAAIRAMLLAGRRTEASTSASDLTDDDFEAAPVLLCLAATAQLATAVPEEFAAALLSEMPFEMSGMLLADEPAAMAARRKATDYYTQASEVAASLGCIEASHDAADRALALALRDPATRTQAKADLEDSMRDSKTVLRRLPLALQFKLKVNLEAVEQEIDRQRALSGNTSLEAAIARLSIALSRDDPRELAAYIDRHRGQLVTHVSRGFLDMLEIEALINSGQLDVAEGHLATLPPEFSRQRERLSILLDAAKGTNPLERLEQQFAATQSVGDLMALVQVLRQEKDWPRLADYAKELFARTSDLPSCTLYAQALVASRRSGDALLFLRDHATLVERSQDLQLLLAQAAYDIGDVLRSKDVIATLRARRDDPRDRDLWLNAAIAAGDWPSLAPFVEEEWLAREQRDAPELLRAAQLAQHLGSPRTKELLFDAAAKGHSDANILVGCYGTAMNIGCETAETYVWLERAAQQSTGEGPVRRLSLKEVMEFDPGWQQRAELSRKQLKAGAIPMRAAVRLLNRSLTELVVLQGRANIETKDVRGRAPVYAYCGNWQQVAIESRSLYLDPTALLTLGLLQSFDLVEAFEQIFIGHSTLHWLFEEQRKVKVFQPSRLTRVEEIHRLVESDSLRRFERTDQGNSELSLAVGDDLAALLGAATEDSSDEKQRVVVRSAPVHRVGSFMEEEADLSAYSAQLCGCLDVVDALATRGQFTAEETSAARSYLVSHEKPWPAPPRLESGAILYLDSVAVANLQHVGALQKLHSAGFTAFIPADLAAEWRDVVGYERLTATALTDLESIRSWLAHGIQAQRVILTARVESNDDRLDAVERELFAGAAKADAVVIDDRYYNQHRRITGDFGDKPVVSTLDLIEWVWRSNPEKRLSARHRLRRAGVVFVPVTVDELATCLSRSVVEGDVLLEAAELAAIRESLQAVRISESLQMPKEHFWLQQVVRAFMSAIKAQWVSEVPDAVARVRSAWLFAQIDFRRWSQLLGGVLSPDGVDLRTRDQIYLLCAVGSGLCDEDRKRYVDWCDDIVLRPLREEQPELFSALVNRTAETVATIADEITAKHG